MAFSEDVFIAIAEPRRREVIALLADGRNRSVGEIVVRTKIAQPSVSKHLAVLRKAGIVTVAKSGQQRMYRLNPLGLKPVHDWAGAFERHWTHQVSEVKRRAEAKALERLVRCDDDRAESEEE